jgi:hypothetical protein
MFLTFNLHDITLYVSKQVSLLEGLTHYAVRHVVIIARLIDLLH